MNKLTMDFFTQKHLIAWVDANFVSFDAKAKAFGLVNKFLDEIAEDGEDEYNLWLNRGWNVIYNIAMSRKDRKEVLGDSV